MNGLVYTLDDSAESTPAYWLGIFFAAALVHVLPLYYMTFHKYEANQDEVVFAVSLDDSFLDFDPTTAAALEPVKNSVVPSPTSSAETAALQPKPNPELPAGEAVEPPPTAKAAPLPKPPTAAAIEAQKTEATKPPEPTPPGAKAVDQKSAVKSFRDIDLPPLAKNNSAFDESTTTTADAPKNGYLSDRNSTAADRGPKNLKLGDPYIEKGHTNVIRYLNPRGEGNLTPFASDANSGSVKKEGTLVEGDGGGALAVDLSKNVKIVPEVAPLPTEVLPPVPATAAVARQATPSPVAPEVTPAAVPPRAPTPIALENAKLRRPSQPLPPEPDPVVVDVGTRLAILGKANKKVEPLPLPVPLPVEPEKPLTIPAAPKVPLEKIPAKAIVDTTDFRHPDGTLIKARPDATGVPAALDAPARPVAKRDAEAELDAFASQLNNVSATTVGGNGTPGSGPKLRRGERGHEGNGTTRPGDSNSVSDVTTINLDSSAAEFGDPRFEKRFDAKTAYVKAFQRRVDNKWKAEIAARLRARIVPGMVSIKIVLRKDGKLLEASEAYRNRGMPDECVATAKHAVQEAADPSADPFPPALADRESIEYTFNFLYQ